MNYAKSRSNIAEERLIRVGITGTGAADPTRRAGPGVTVTRTAQGVYKYTFADNPGTFVGINGPCLRADTPSAVKDYSVSGDTYTSPTGSADGFIEVSVWDAAAAAVDLAAAQYLDLTFVFAAQSVIK